MKIIALDIGDVWTGIAISDAAGITCRPLDTVRTADLEAFLSSLFERERIGSIIVGLPLTLSGGESDQTRKIKTLFNHLTEAFSDHHWELVDERYTSQRAQETQKTTKRPPTKEEKHREHAIAAAHMLHDYLMHRFKK